MDPEELRLLRRLKVPADVRQEECARLRDLRIRHFVTRAIQRGLLKLQRAAAARRLETHKLLSALRQARHDLKRGASGKALLLVPT